MRGGTFVCLAAIWLVGCADRVGGPTPSAEQADGARVDELRAYVEREIAIGFASPMEIAEGAIDLCGEGGPESEIRGMMRLMIRDALAAHWQAQRHWPEVTDCDRLDRSFAALEAAGIVARQNFSDCGTCGEAEIREALAAALAGARAVRGYVFYHVQDTEGAVDGEGIHVSYGGREEGERAALAVGREIVAELERQGLRTDWDGTWQKRIRVVLDWKRRRPEPKREGPQAAPGR
jgi:hypothetical protein